MTSPLASTSVEALGLDPKPLGRLRELITAHIAEGRYPAAQIAVARHGKLGLVWTLGDARLPPERVPARDETLWLLFSNTKVITACAVWLLVERGALAFTDRVADHVPGFEANGKGDISIIQLLSPQGGFPNAETRRPRGRITGSCGAPCAASRSNGRRARVCTTTGAPRTGWPRS